MTVTEEKGSNYYSPFANYLQSPEYLKNQSQNNQFSMFHFENLEAKYEMEKNEALNKQEILNNQLLEKSEAGDFQAVKQLLCQKADPNTMDSNGETPLHRTAFKSHIIVMRELIINGGNLYATNKAGETPITYAIKACKLKAVKDILNFGGYNINYKDNNIKGSRTPLEDAVYYADSQMTIAKYLLKKGASSVFGKKSPIFKIKKVPTQTKERRETDVIVPCKKTINSLIKKGVSAKEISKLVEGVSDAYFEGRKMTSHIWDEFVHIERNLSRQAGYSDY